MTSTIKFDLKSDAAKAFQAATFEKIKELWSVAQRAARANAIDLDPSQGPLSLG